MFGAGFYLYEKWENDWLADRAWIDTKGFLAGLAIGAIVIKLNGGI